MKFKGILVLLFCALVSHAQTNLVPNGSFEDINGCPHSASLFDTTLNSNWFQPTNGTADVYTECSTVIGGRNVPDNPLGFQYAQEGVSYVGIITRWTIGNYREYIAVKLTDSLKHNMYYCLNYYVSLSDGESLIISSIGSYFTEDSLHFSNISPMPLIPQIKNPSTNFIADTVNWKLITGYFQAIGGEQYMYIGNFYNDANTVIQPNSPDYRTYMYIDNVQLYECDSVVAINEIKPANLNLYSNPATTFITIDVPTQSTLQILTMQGQVVKTLSVAKGQQQIAIEDLPAGIYQVVLSDEGRVVGREKLVVVR